MQFTLNKTNACRLIVFGLFLVGQLGLILYMTHESPEERAIREWVGVPETDSTILYLMLLMATSAAVILLFRIQESRRKVVGMLVVIAAIFPVLLMRFQWRWIVSAAAVMLIVLIGWLYPSKRADRDQI